MVSLGEVNSRDLCCKMVHLNSSHLFQNQTSISVAEAQPNYDEKRKKISEQNSKRSEKYGYKHPVYWERVLCLSHSSKTTCFRCELCTLFLEQHKLRCSWNITNTSCKTMKSRQCDWSVAMNVLEQHKLRCFRNNPNTTLSDKPSQYKVRTTVCESDCVPSMAKGFPTVSSLQSASMETSKSNRALSMMNASRLGGSVLHHRHTHHKSEREALIEDNKSQTVEKNPVNQINSPNFLRLPRSRAGSCVCGSHPLCHLYRGWD